MKKVALLGNMNNNHNSVTRYLRDMGFDAQLFLYENEASHFLPSFDQYDNYYKEYTNHLSWGSYKNLVFLNKKKIQNDLKEFDFVIGSRLAPAYLNKAGIVLDMAIPTGSDLYEFPFFQGFQPKLLLKYLFVSKYQRKGFQECKHLVWDETNPEIEDKINQINFQGNRLRAGVPMIYIPEYTESNIEKYIDKSVLYDKFKRIRDENDLFIFHHVRHFWKAVPLNMPEHDKANDRLFRALKQYIVNNPKIRVGVATFDYGPDAYETRNLIKELGIEKNVYWFDVAPRKEIMIGIGLADIVAGEFKNSYLTYGTVLEAMTMKTLIIHNRKNEEIYKKNYGELYDMIHAETIDEIISALNQYMNNKIYYDTEATLQAFNWLKKYVIEKSINYIVESINSK